MVGIALRGHVDDQRRPALQPQRASRDESAFEAMSLTGAAGLCAPNRAWRAVPLVIDWREGWSRILDGLRRGQVRRLAFRRRGRVRRALACRGNASSAVCRDGRPSARECNGPPVGGAEGDRTPDLLIANEALSQLSYSPDDNRLGARRARIMVGGSPVKQGHLC